MSKQYVAIDMNMPVCSQTRGIMASGSLSTGTVSSRRPAFDRESEVEIAEALFHAKGYEAVGIRELLTQALDIVPPVSMRQRGQVRPSWPCVAEIQDEARSPCRGDTGARYTTCGSSSRPFCSRCRHSGYDPVRR